ncbi:hypothetical protein DY000_02020267 [Brassica cretica]|uniref:Uncharacterized protein n=1 Tax=Brassica cretica TaxID=69181 RepID=A0ABQ7EJW2_BRACR|nr:hypothetical protein DY000_02020267 [Brassica cretica]
MFQTGPMVIDALGVPRTQDLTLLKTLPQDELSPIDMQINNLHGRVVKGVGALHGCEPGSARRVTTGPTFQPKYYRWDGSYLDLSDP